MNPRATSFTIKTPTRRYSTAPPPERNTILPLERSGLGSTFPPVKNPPTPMAFIPENHDYLNNRLWHDKAEIKGQPIILDAIVPTNSIEMQQLINQIRDYIVRPYLILPPVHRLWLYEPDHKTTRFFIQVAPAVLLEKMGPKFPDLFKEELSRLHTEISRVNTHYKLSPGTGLWAYRVLSLFVVKVRLDATQELGANRGIIKKTGRWALAPHMAKFDFGKGCERFKPGMEIPPEIPQIDGGNEDGKDEGEENKLQQETRQKNRTPERPTAEQQQSKEHYHKDSNIPPKNSSSRDKIIPVAIGTVPFDVTVPRPYKSRSVLKPIPRPPTQYQSPPGNRRKEAFSYAEAALKGEKNVTNVSGRKGDSASKFFQAPPVAGRNSEKKLSNRLKMLIANEEEALLKLDGNSTTSKSTPSKPRISAVAFVSEGAVPRVGTVSSPVRTIFDESQQLSSGIASGADKFLQDALVEDKRRAEELKIRGDPPRAPSPLFIGKEPFKKRYATKNTRDTRIGTRSSNEEKKEGGFFRDQTSYVGI